MNRIHTILTGPFFVALFGMAFCVWTALGNDVNICVTSGCSLYEDFTFAGISLWWIGSGAFAVLCAVALGGLAFWGRILAGIFLCCDICLLLLMALTAPCINCLVVAILLALSFYLFRPPANSDAQPRRLSPLLWIWGAFFIVNLGMVARSQIDIWPILDESGEARTRMFFSPTCKFCAEGINALSGNVNVAFYPIAENDDDLWRVANMRKLLDEGLGMAEALGKSQDIQQSSFSENFRPDILLLRFRLLRNKAHVFISGSRGVPFFEMKGLPSLPSPKVERAPLDPSLPLELGGGQCGAGTPCADSQ